MVDLSGEVQAEGGSVGHQSRMLCDRECVEYKSQLAVGTFIDQPAQTLPARVEWVKLCVDHDVEHAMACVVKELRVRDEPLYCRSDPANQQDL